MTDRSLAIQRERDLAEDWDRTGLRWVQCWILCDCAAAQKRQVGSGYVYNLPLSPEMI